MILSLFSSLQCFVHSTQLFLSANSKSKKTVNFTWFKLQTMSYYSHSSSSYDSNEETGDEEWFPTDRNDENRCQNTSGVTTRSQKRAMQTQQTTKKKKRSKPKKKSKKKKKTTNEG